MDELRSGDTTFLEMKAVGTLIEAALNYTFTIQMAAKATNISEFSDQDGVYAIEWDFETTFDPTWNKAFNVTVINTTIAL